MASFQLLHFFLFFSLVGFKGNLSLLDFFFSRGVLANGSRKPPARKGVEGATVFLCSEPGGRTCGWESSLPNAGFQAGSE